MCVFVLQDGICRAAEEPFRCRDTGFPVVWKGLFYGAESAFLWCGMVVQAWRLCEECPPEWVLWRCGGYGGAWFDGVTDCSERFLFSVLKEKNVMIFYCPYCINIHFRQCRAAISSYPYIRPARSSDCFVMPKKHSHKQHDGNEMRAMIWWGWMRFPSGDERRGTEFRWGYCLALCGFPLGRRKILRPHRLPPPLS